MTTVELVDVQRTERATTYCHHARLPGAPTTLCGRKTRNPALHLRPGRKPDCKLCLRKAVEAGVVYRYDSFDDVRAAPGYKKRLGNCYQLAAQWILYDGGDDHFFAGLDTDNGRTLVHGTIQRGWLPALGHAWVIEADGNVRDCVLGVTFHPDDFERLFNPVVIATYTKEEASQHIVEHGHWGSWHEEFVLHR